MIWTRILKFDLDTYFNPIKVYVVQAIFLFIFVFFIHLNFHQIKKINADKNNEYILTDLSYI